MTTLLCPWDAPQFLIYSSNIPPLLFYTHIPAMLIALILGILVIAKSKESIVAKSLLLIVTLFFIWSFIDLILWATNSPSNVIFFWSMQVLIEPLIFGLSLYLSYVFMFKKDMPFWGKLIVSIPVLPLIIFLSTKYNLIGVNLVDCTAIEGFFATFYSYTFEILYTGLILVMTIWAFIKSKDTKRKNEVKYFGMGIIFFLFAFSWGNIIGSFSSNWTLAQVGFIGMPIFVAVLAYTIVRFKTFNIKLLGAQALVFALGLLVLAITFIRDIDNVRTIVMLTLAFVIALGYTLIKSVRKEVMQREQLQILSDQLFEANEKLKGLDKLKSEFLSLAAHQLRSPLTAMKGYASMVLEGSYGEINPQVKDAVGRIFQSSQNLAKVVEDLLDVSKIEQGGMKFTMEPFSLAEIARDMAKDLSITAEKRGLKMEFEADTDQACVVNGDKEKLRQVVLNFIDNSIKYTKEGTINVSVRREKDKVLFKVKDTGMGMTPEIKASLFQKFARGDGARMNTTGSGLGLYLAKEIVEAHKGRVWVDSEGPGKGSTFAMELVDTPKA
jgi:signal transduction histidine kinase